MNAGKVWILVGTLLFSSSGAQGYITSTDNRNPAQYVAPNQTPRNADQIPLSRPLWHEEHDPTDFSSGLGNVYLRGNMLFFLKQGQLVVLETNTGKRLWKYGSGLTHLFFEDYSIFVADRRGSVFQVLAETGKTLWGFHTGLERIDDLRRVSPFVFATQKGEETVALLGLAARAFWRAKLDGAQNPVLYNGKYVLFKRSAGEPAQTIFEALERRTGKVLWSSRGGFTQILRSDFGSGTLEVYQAPGLSEIIDGPRNRYTLLKISTKTGETLKKTTFEVPAREGCGEPNTYTQHAILQAESLWLDVSDTCGPFIARFIQGVEAKKPLLYAVDGISAWLAGPLEDRLFVQRNMPQLGRISLEGVGISSAPTLLYEYGGAPITSLNLIDRYLFVTSLDGGFNAFVRSSAQHLLRAYLPARAFGPTLYSEGVAVVQAENTLYGFKIP